MAKIEGSHSPLMFDEKRAKEHAGILKALSLLSRVKKMGLTGILTCNFDTVVECALGTSSFNYGILSERLEGRGHNPVAPWQYAHRRVSGNIRLAKLHGSLSWTETAKFTSGKPGRAGRALIVPPAPEKFPPPELIDVWKLGEEILRASSALVVFGFAFNPYDAALLDFLRAAGKKLNRVLLIDPYPNHQAATALWPSARIEALAPDEYLLDALSAWDHGA